MKSRCRLWSRGLRRAGVAYGVEVFEGGGWWRLGWLAGTELLEGCYLVVDVGLVRALVAGSCCD